MHKSGDNTSSVWPAYVAVMACLIQIMMLLVVVLATGVMTMNSQTSSLKAAIARLFLDQQLQTQAALEADGRTGENRNAEEQVQTSQLVAASRLVFQADALQLNEAARKNLTRFVIEHRTGTEAEWEIVTQGEQLSGSTDRRAAFLRLLDVRQVLIETGVKEQRIQTKIEERSTSQGTSYGDMNTVSIYVRRAPPSPQPQR